MGLTPLTASEELMPQVPGSLLASCPSMLLAEPPLPHLDPVLARQGDLHDENSFSGNDGIRGGVVGRGDLGLHAGLCCGEEVDMSM